MDLHIGQIEVSNSGYLRRSMGRFEDGDFYRDDRALTTLRFGYEVVDGVTPYIGLGFEKNWEKHARRAIAKVINPVPRP